MTRRERSRDILFFLIVFGSVVLSAAFVFFDDGDRVLTVTHVYRVDAGAGFEYADCSPSRLAGARNFGEDGHRRSRCKYFGDGIRAGGGPGRRMVPAIRDQWQRRHSFCATDSYPNRISGDTRWSTAAAQRAGNARVRVLRDYPFYKDRERWLAGWWAVPD